MSDMRRRTWTWVIAAAAVAAGTASACGSDDPENPPGPNQEAGAGPTLGGAGAGEGGSQPTPTPVGGAGGEGNGGNAGAGKGEDAGAPTTDLPVKLRFSPRVGNEEFSCASTYEDLGTTGATVHPVDFKFYIHDLRVISESGEEVAVELEQTPWQNEGVALLDFEDQSGSCSNGTTATNTEIVGTVPSGRYNGIAFRLGVPFELNHTNADTAEAPLNDTTMYWGWNLGRLFLSVMNEVEPDGAGGAGGAGGAPAAPFVSVLHLGSTGCEGDAAVGGVSSCAKPNRPEFRMTPFDLGSNVLVADVKAVLQRSDLTRDLCHSFSAEACSWPFDFLGLNWFTGSLTPSTQRFFRVE